MKINEDTMRWKEILIWFGCNTETGHLDLVVNVKHRHENNLDPDFHPENI